MQFDLGNTQWNFIIEIISLAWLHQAISMWKVNHKLTSLRNSYFNAGFPPESIWWQISTFIQWFVSEGVGQSCKKIILYSLKCIQTYSLWFKDIHRVLERIEEIKQTQGESALPLNRAKAVKAKWKSLARMSVLFGGFTPQYPVTLSINTKTFCNAFPYHILFSNTMCIIHSGIKVSTQKKLKELLAEPREPFEVLAPLKTRGSPNTGKYSTFGSCNSSSWSHWGSWGSHTL